jgi:predicted  nucleic acid-binding Zn-ribbon protein
VSLTEHDRRYLDLRFHRIERLIRMATQAEVDAITAEVTALEAPLADLGTAIDALEAQVAAGQDITDVSALRSAADAVRDQVAGLGAKIPSAPATPTATEPSPDA